MNAKAAPHPGAMIKKNIVEAKGLNVTSTAKILNVGRQAMSALLNERADLSLEMALRIEKAFGISADLLAKMQLAYDMAQLRQTENNLGVKSYEG
ncbi:MAG: HigA family addiction module antidote protein [Rhodospirillales bacterium]|nr:HigA family addiction module antidote protein [Rhodospirillales bacterium]